MPPTHPPGYFGSSSPAELRYDEFPHPHHRLFRSSSLAVLEDEEVRGNARQLVLALLEQPLLQAKTGEHLWAAMKGGILGLGYPKPKAPQPMRPLPSAASDRTTGGVTTGEAAGGVAAGGGPPAGTADTSGLKTPAATAAAAAAGLAAKAAGRPLGSPEEAELEASAAEGGRPLEREFALVRRASDSLDRRRRPADWQRTEADQAQEARGGRTETAATPASLQAHEQGA